MRKITVSDYTLREMGESGSSRLLFREKLAIALAIDRYGADVIELPRVRNPKEDLIVCKTIAQSVRFSSVALPVGDTADDVKTAADCIRNALRPRLIVSLPVSTVQMEYMYRLKAPKMLDKIREMVGAARALCEDVEFEALDATRCELSYLVQACTAAKESGATSVSLSDNAGIMLPEEFASVIKELKKEVSLAVVAKVSDKISLAVADALSALQAGASGVKVAVSGSEALNIDAFSEAVKIKGDVLGISTNLKLTEIHSDIESLLKKIKGKDEAEEFFVPAGAAVFLDAESTIQQVGEAVKSLGYDLSDEDLGKVFEALQRLCEQKSSIGNKELDAIIASTAMQVPATFKLKSYIGTMSNKVNSVTNVILERDGEKLSGTGTGGGPIDSAFMAIEQCIGHHYELDDFQIQAVTEGKESLGSALVRLRSNGKLYSGNGLSSDICGASIRAYINALNKIAYEESQR
ncbi:MAG: hypothetical protein J5599_06535 [Spirochaetales bacterium]|nr:hypothetical protein [Spirochaetales bacterium]